jgi:GNAT superfamily N-acetyltransferase
MPDAETVLIRLFEPRDRHALDACIRELQEHEREIEPRMKPADDILPTYVEDLLERCAAHRGAILIAECDGTLVGYTTVLAALPNDDPDEIDYAYAYIHDIAVRSDLRGKGIGKLLLTEADTFAREQGAVCLRISVLAENGGALSLYQSFGFKPRVVELEKSVD